MGKVTVFDHPLIQHKLSIMREKDTSVKEFRELVSEVATLMCYEATRDLPLEEVDDLQPSRIGKRLEPDGDTHRILGRQRVGISSQGCAAHGS